MTASQLLIDPSGQVSTASPEFTGVQIVRPGQGRLTDEISDLLRHRVANGIIFCAIILFVGLLTTLHLPLVFPRVLLLVGIILLGALLKSRAKLSSATVRFVEMVMLGVVCVQATIMPNALILDSARAGDAVTVAMDEYFVRGFWAVALVFYGLYIPNTWRRAALIILPLAFLPTLNFYLLAWYEPLARKAFESLHHGPPMPVELLGALGGICGAHMLSTIRKDEFKARQLGQYTLKELLGSGGMGEVYRAEHNLLKRPCAIKLIRTGARLDSLAIARFEREARATAQLTHPSTIEVYDFGQAHDGALYYVMEMLQGMSLQDMVTRSGPMPAARAAYFLRQICGALKEAHTLGIIHRDIKPGNIFAARLAGQCDVAKLLDFGLVQMPEVPDSDVELTRKGLICGSPLYMSPEQARASESLDARTDIYSLGASLYFLVTGRPPFVGKSKMDVLIALTRDEAVAPSQLVASLEADFESLILKCLQKRPEDRYQNIDELLGALSACQCDGQWTQEWAQLWWLKQDQLVTSPAQPLGESEFVVVLPSDKTIEAAPASQSPTGSTPGPGATP